jgi:protein involved in polysaccharide export with SLBB domain
MPSFLIRITAVAAVFLAAQSTGSTQGLVGRPAQATPAYPAATPANPVTYMPQERIQVVDPNKKLSTGDELTVEIVEDKEGGVRCIVTAAGAIDVQPLGRVQVAGRTTTEASADIKRRLEADYYYRATVKMNIDRVAPGVVQSGVVHLSGQVRRPGQLGMIVGEELRLSTAILKAGDFTEWGNSRKVQVVRQENGKPVTTVYDVKKIMEKGDENADPLLKDGDRIFVPKTLIRF